MPHQVFIPFGLVGLIGLVAGEQQNLINFFRSNYFSYFRFIKLERYMR